MNIENLIELFEHKIKRVNSNNHFDIYLELESKVKNYQESGGLGIPLYEFLWEKYFDTEDQEILQDIFGDIMNKMSGHCTANQEINFDDINFDKFDRESGKFQ